MVPLPRCGRDGPGLPLRALSKALLLLTSNRSWGRKVAMDNQNSRLIDRRSVLAATALIAAAPKFAFAQDDYPSHAIKFVVPVPPGNMLDAMPRIIGDKLSPRWNQPVIV